MPTALEITERLQFNLKRWRFHNRRWSRPAFFGTLCKIRLGATDTHVTELRPLHFISAIDIPQIDDCRPRT